MAILKEAMYFRLMGHEIRCELCPHQCLIKPGETGKCRVRRNNGGVLVPENYGLLCAMQSDPIEKKPLYHFLPGSQAFSIASPGCNFRCSHCQNHHISQHNHVSGMYKMLPQEVIETALLKKASTIAYTYTEPTIWFEYMLETSMLAHQHGIRNIMVSNGFINPEPLKQLLTLMDGANIDLKFFNQALYRKVTGGSLLPVLRSLELIQKSGTWLEITTLMIPTLSDRPEEIRKMCQWLYQNGFQDTPVHFSRFFPAFQLQHLPPTAAGRLLEARENAISEGLRYVYLGNISDQTGHQTWCPGCNALLIERMGYSIAKNLIQRGKCPECGEAIAGVWE